MSKFFQAKQKLERSYHKCNKSNIHQEEERMSIIGKIENII
jgi:hypothetical protein